jgi:hypothetical protein
MAFCDGGSQPPLVLTACQPEKSRKGVSAVRHNIQKVLWDGAVEGAMLHSTGKI